MKITHLYIDELGNPNPLSSSHDYFIVTACIVADGVRESAKVFANQIKFKYWGNKSDYQDIIFHSYEIGRRTGSFAIFQNDDQRYKEFLSDLMRLLKSGGLNLFIAVTDLAEAKAKNWNSNAVLKRTSDHIVRNFVYYLLGSQNKGKIIIESATEAQNKFFLGAFSYYLSPNAVPEVDFRTIQTTLTSMSVVTKNNYDIEEQIADLFAYAARCKFEKDEKGKAFEAGSYEAKMVSILENKLFVTPPAASPAKKRYYNKIESFRLLTK